MNGYACDDHLLEGVRAWTKTFGAVQITPRLNFDDFVKCNVTDCDTRSKWYLS